jgi:uncharacterized delta-60 repeat protein
MHRSLTGALALIALMVPASAAAAPGDLDPGFGSGGVATLTPGTGEQLNIAWSVAVTPDGGSVMAGSGAIGPDTALAVVRLRPDGSPDRGFGGDGSVVLRLGRDAGMATSPELAHVAVQPDGRTVVALGANDAAGNMAATLVRLTTAGEPDPFFGTGGVVHEQLGLGGGTADSRYYGVAVQPDGRIVASGVADGAPGTTDLVVRRYTPSGDPDGTFASGGTLRTELSEAAAPTKRTTGLRLATHPGGGVVVTGVTNDAAGNAQGFVARVTGAGALAPDFAAGGVRRVQLGTGASANTTPLEPVVLPGGAVAVGGVVDNARGFVLRLTPSGDVDTGWADAGRRTLSLGTTQTIVYGLGAEPNGRLLVPIAYDGAGGVLRGGVLRLTRGGDVDDAFGGDGLVDHQLSPASPAKTYGLDAVWHPDGKVIVSGARETSPSVLELFALRVVADTPPNAAVAGPASAVRGQAVTFDASGSSDPGGAVASHDWDLDADGAFDDATGPTASVTPGAAGSLTVRVRVRDDNGLVAVAARDLAVAERPAPTPPAAGPPAAGQPAAGPPAAGPGAGSGGAAPVAGTAVRRGRAVLVAGRLRQDARGRALVRLRCPAGGTACRGVVAFRVAGRDAGRVAYAVGAGRTATARLPLGRAARRVLGSERSARLSLRLTRDGGSTVVRRVTVLRRPR